MANGQAAGSTMRVADTVESFEQRLRFECLLADLSARFANVSAESLEREIEDALRKLIEFLGFDRSSFVEIHGDGSSTTASVRASPQGGAAATPTSFSGARDMSGTRNASAFDTDRASQAREYSSRGSSSLNSARASSGAASARSGGGGRRR